MDKFMQLNKPLPGRVRPRATLSPVSGERTAKKTGPERLGESVRQLFEGGLADRQKKSGDVIEIWPRILPKELEGHCTIEQIKDGLLKVQSDMPCYAYQFRMHSSEILNLLKEFCPAARIKKISVAVRGGQVS
jgi:hypothetical protein